MSTNQMTAHGLYQHSYREMVWVSRTMGDSHLDREGGDSDR